MKGGQRRQGYDDHKWMQGINERGSDGGLWRAALTEQWSRRRPCGLLRGSRWRAVVSNLLLQLSCCSCSWCPDASVDSCADAAAPVALCK